MDALFGREGTVVDVVEATDRSVGKVDEEYKYLAFEPSELSNVIKILTRHGYEFSRPLNEVEAGK